MKKDRARRWRLFRRSDKRDLGPETHQPAIFADASFANRMATANAIAEQIWREQQLVSTRMTWNFSFQAFLTALYVFSGSDLEGWQMLAIQLTLGLVGMSVAFSIWQAVLAAQAQSSRLKAHWTAEFCATPSAVSPDTGCNVQSGPFPQPFSMSSGSRKGRGASNWICGIIMGMWTVLCIISVVDFLDADTSSKVSISSKPDKSLEIEFVSGR